MIHPSREFASKRSNKTASLQGTDGEVFALDAVHGKFKPDYIPTAVGGGDIQGDLRELRLSFKEIPDDAADQWLGMGRRLWKV